MKITRKYFYYLDLKGKLFLEETKVKNYTTCYKDTKFLNFFFKNLKVNPEYNTNNTNNTNNKNNLNNSKQTNNSQNTCKYPFVSVCMGEYMYLNPEDTPIVYFDLKTLNENSLVNSNSLNSEISKPNNDQLIYGGNLHSIFNPSKLIYNSVNS